jgi:hypothetical protein
MSRVDDWKAWKRRSDELHDQYDEKFLNGDGGTREEALAALAKINEHDRTQPKLHWWQR